LTRPDIKSIFFDLGGTLMYDKDPWPPFFPRADKAMWEVLHAAGVTLEPADLYGEFNNLFELYYARREPELEEPTTLTVLDELLRQKGFRLSKTVISSALRAMYAVTQSNWYPEKDAAPTLENLRDLGFRIGYVSNGADDENTQVLIDKADIRVYADLIISSAAFGMRKPHPAIFQAALDHFKLTPPEAAMVGDTLEADILGANRMGMVSIWITRRAQVNPARGNEIKPSMTVDTLSEIPERLSELG
jgi:HAD superfamily hydrolase (TIGR01662 family)